MSVQLPNFTNTEEAVRFGLMMTRDQFVSLNGARDALQREFDRLTLLHKESCDKGNPNRTLLQICADLATTIQKMRESLEVAPDIVLASMIGGNRCDPFTGSGSRLSTDRPNSQLLTPNSTLAEPVAVGHL